MNALVISGGGSKGAFAGGIVDYLINTRHKKYNLFIGSSTGALLLPLAATNSLTRLNVAYTSVSQEDIFDVNPFKVIQNKNGQTKITLNKKAIIKNVLPSYKVFVSRKFPIVHIKKIPGSTSFGDSSKLNSLIKTFVTEKDFQTLRSKENIEVVVAVTNFTTGEIEYKSSINWGYLDFIDWMQASSSAYPFMSIVEKEGMQYIDGGTLESTPIQEAINRGATSIDVIILREEVPKFNSEFVRNLFHGIIKINEMMWSEINREDIRISHLYAKNKNVKLNVYYTPRRLTNNSLIFDKNVMSEWWDEGFEYAKNTNPVSIVLKKSK